MANIFDLPQDQVEILRAALDSQGRLEVIVPREMTIEDLYNQTAACCIAQRELQNGLDKLRPIIGRLLLLMKNNPESYQAKGFRTFEDFLRLEVGGNWGVGRSTAYECIRQVEKWPDLDIDTYLKIGPSKFAVINKFSDQSHSDHKRVLEKAKTCTLTRLREWAETTGRVNKGETVPAMVVIPTTLETKRCWEELIHNRQCIEACGSEAPGVILQHMIEEFSSVWMAVEETVGSAGDLS